MPLPLHVCIDCRLFNASGIGTLLKSLLRALYHENLVLTLLTLRQNIALLKNFTKQLIVMKSNLFSIREQLEYCIKIPSCDLFLSPHFNVPLLPIRAKKRMSLLCDVYHLAHFTTLTLTQKVYAKLLYNAAFFLSDHVVTISEFSKKEILKYASLRPKKLEVLTIPLEFKPIIRQKKEFLLYVGNLKPHKNLLRLVKAYAKLRPPNPLYIVGKKEGFIAQDTALFQEIEKDAFLKKNVSFMGYVEEKELKILYAEAFVVLFPSLYEGFGYPPLEAMACGCPVVASKTASIPEVCQDAVEYIDPHCVDSIAKGIERLLTDHKRRNELIERGKVLIEKREKEKNNILEIIHACCSCA